MNMMVNQSEFTDTAATDPTVNRIAERMRVMCASWFMLHPV